jgi:nucleoid-associated protein YgaU
MSFNCPICEKAGLPDYTKTNVICPQCNSDLKAFILLHSISKSKNSRVSKPVIVSFSFLLICLLGFTFTLNYRKNDLILKNKVLNDSIAIMYTNSTLEKPDIQLSTNKEVSLKYVVKKGDCPYKLALFFYNDGSKYKKIEKDNKLTQPYTLKVGQILTIKISE